MKKNNNLSNDRLEYKRLVQEEIDEWKKIETEMVRKGIPWWVDLRQAKVTGKNIFWRNDPKKESIVRGEEKKELIKLATRKRGKVLDLGCGSGWLSLELARMGMDVLGIDVSPDRLLIAREFMKKNPYKEGFGSLTYKLGDLNEIDLPTQEFDVVVAWDTLHHFPELDNIVKKVKSSLKPNGKLIIYDHLGNRYLKTANKVFNFLTRKKEKIMPYEDVLGPKMIDIIQKEFLVKKYKTRLSFPVSAMLFLVFGRDIFFSLLPTVVKIDNILCNLRLFTGEYFFLYGQKK